MIKKAHDKIINIYFGIQKYSKRPRIYIILKCILLQNGKFWRDGFLIFFSKDLVEQCLYSVGCCFLLQIFVFNDTFNVQNFTVFFKTLLLYVFFKMFFPFHFHFIITILGQIGL